MKNTIIRIYIFFSLSYIFSRVKFIIELHYYESECNMWALRVCVYVCAYVRLVGPYQDWLLNTLSAAVEYLRDRLDPDIRDGFDQADLCAATISERERLSASFVSERTCLWRQ